MPLGIHPDMLGLRVSGDLGEMTMYTTRHLRMVIYPKSPPQMPATPGQVRHRTRWAIAVENWKALPDYTRDEWERVSIEASLMMTGHNLWMHFSFSQDQESLASLNRQANASLSLPPPLPS